MKTKITQLSMLFIALFFINNISAQSGDWEFLFEVDDDTEGWILFNASDPLTVSGGAMTYTYGTSTDGFQLNPPASAIHVDKTNFPYLAIKLSANPSARKYMFLQVNGTGGWYGNKINPPADTDLDPENVFYYDMSAALYTTTEVPDGEISRLIFNLEDASEATVDVEWIKTFASVQAIKDYVATLSTDDVSKSLTKVISRENGIDIVEAKINSKIEVFNLLGKKLYSSIVKSEDVSIPLLSKGLHIVKISDKTSVIAKKVILK